MDERDKIIAFLAHLLQEIICHGTEFISLDDMQALDNIVDDLPEVTAKDFRW